MSILRITCALGAMAALVACSGSDDDQSGASDTGSGGAGAGSMSAGGSNAGGAVPFTSAPHPTAPQVVTLGGTVLTAPKIQPIAYQSDAGLSDIEAFLQELTTSAYWSDATSEYGVGPLTILPTIVITDPAPSSISNSTITGSLETNLTGTTPAWGAADPSTVYLFVLPEGTSTDDQGGIGCQDFDGYHDQASVGSTSVSYAISCACPHFDGPGIDDTQQRTVNISHELVEAATDPFPFRQPAWAQEDQADIVWTAFTGGELADMCEFNLDSYYVPPGSTYMVQRSWSNAAALAGTNPCVPRDAGEVYFNTYPALDSVSWAPPFSPSFMTNGVQIAVGQQKTIELQLSSTAPTSGPWHVSVYDYDELYTGAQPKLGLSLDASSGQNGDVLHLTITVNGTDQMLAGEAFAVISDLGHPGDADFAESISFGLVVN
jgi:hypothetical protein